MSVLKYVLYAVVAWVVFQLYSFVDIRLRARRHNGGFAPNGAHWPFGLDFLLITHKLSSTFRNYEVFRERTARYGRTYGQWLLGTYVVITSDPENIKAVLATQFTDFGKGESFSGRWEQFLGRGIFNADGETWSHARSMMRPQFLKERVADLDNFEDKMQGVFKRITSGAVVDVMDLWFRFTMDSATEHLFGHCAKSLSMEEDNNQFASIFARVQELQTKRERHGPLWKLFSSENAKMNESMGQLNRFVDEYVQLALNAEVDEKDESLLAALASENRDPVFLRDAMVSALLAGRDTTAATLSWLIKEVSKDPELYKELRGEVLEVLGPDEIPTYSQLKNFKLLQATINETLRLYPIVPFNIRAAFKDTTLPHGAGSDGKSPLFIPANSAVAYSTLVMQRLQDIHRVEDWLPRRWVDGVDGTPKYTPAHWSYIPFNGGPRICLGQNFAL